MSKHNELGKDGEILAAQFLKNKGHEILEINFRTGRKEIDIISKITGFLVFSEIKTRSGIGFGFPEEAVDKRKQAFLKEAAAFYLAEHPEFEHARFDVISIIITDGEASEIRHFEDAFC